MIIERAVRSEYVLVSANIQSAIASVNFFYVSGIIKLNDIADDFASVSWTIADATWRADIDSDFFVKGHGVGVLLGTLRGINSILGNIGWYNKGVLAELSSGEGIWGLRP